MYLQSACKNHHVGTAWCQKHQTSIATYCFERDPLEYFNEQCIPSLEASKCVQSTRDLGFDIIKTNHGELSKSIEHLGSGGKTLAPTTEDLYTTEYNVQTWMTPYAKSEYGKQPFRPLVSEDWKKNFRSRRQLYASRSTARHDGQ